MNGEGSDFFRFDVEMNVAALPRLHGEREAGDAGGDVAGQPFAVDVEAAGDGHGHFDDHRFVVQRGVAEHGLHQSVFVLVNQVVDRAQVYGGADPEGVVGGRWGMGGRGFGGSGGFGGWPRRGRRDRGCGRRRGGGGGRRGRRRFGRGRGLIRRRGGRRWRRGWASGRG